MSRKSKNPNIVNYYPATAGGVAVVPCVVLENDRYRDLTPVAKEVLTYITAQYNGSNNGDLCATLSVFKKKYGFKSQDSLTRAIKQLLENGLISVTRFGGKDYKTGRNLPTLYAVTWQSVDVCKNKLDVADTNKPEVDFLSEWKKST